MTFNKIFSFFFILLGTNFLYSNEDVQEKEYSNEYTKKEEDLFNKDYSAVFINGEFLYWTVSEGALDYALVMKDSCEPCIIYASGDFKSAKFDWDPGFRIALGYFYSQKLMNVWGEYTRLRVKNSNSVSPASSPGDV